MLLTKLKIATTALTSCALVFVTGWTLRSAVRSDQPNGTSPPNGFPVSVSKASVGDNKASEARSKPRAEERSEIELRDLNQGWGSVTNSDGDCTFKADKGKLTITVPGNLHDLHPNRGMNAPRVLQEVEGDFTATVKVTCALTPGKGVASYRR